MPLTYTRRRLSTRDREALYDRCCSDKAVPDCNICHLPILLNEPWDESHDPEGPPHALGGTETGVAHRDCNRRHGAQVVTPMVAKAKRVRQKFIGAFVTRHKLPGGRDSAIKKKVGGGVVVREPRVRRVTSFDDRGARLAVIGDTGEEQNPIERR